MELFLNLCWLMLALPAYWMWRHESEGRDGPRLRRLRSFVLLACVLMLLFPVISATDDMHAMRPEIEESSSSKQIARHIAADKSASPRVAIGSPAQISSFFTFHSTDRGWGNIPAPVNLPLSTPPPSSGTSRAPPSLTFFAV